MKIETVSCPDRPAVSLPAADGLDQRPRKIIHIDMDAFYASVEQRDNPDLRCKPVAVGGEATWGVVAAASYEAHAFGVHSAMPSVTVRRKCPNLIFVRPRFDVYKEVYSQIRAIFHEYTPAGRAALSRRGLSRRDREPAWHGLCNRDRRGNPRPYPAGRRLQASLARQSVIISEKVVQRLMKQEQLVVAKPRRRRFGSYLGEISPAPRT